MIKERLSDILKQKKSNNSLFTRNLLKEGIQDYILNFIYNHRFYKKLVFTGGTCLRKIYGLPRLSEDLDFDFIGKFEVEKFAQNAKDYFQKNLQYKKVETRISRNKKTVFLKFPQILEEIGLVKSRADSSLLFVRVDFSQEKLGSFKTEVSSISTSEFTFFVLAYDLETLFSNKIAAFLNREFFRGKEQSLAFKGRDLFDLVWFFERFQKSGFQFQPNWKRALKDLKVKGKKEALDLLVKKVGKIKEKEVRQDLEPFIESGKELEAFSNNFKKIIENRAKKMMVTG